MIGVHQFLRVVDITHTAVVLGVVRIGRRAFVLFAHTGGAGSEREIHLVHSSKMKVIAASVGVSDGAHATVEAWVVDVWRRSSMVENGGLTVAHYIVSLR